MAGHSRTDRILPAPGERPTLDLGPGEIFVVAALRAWVAPHMRPGGGHPDWREVFRLAGVGAPAAVAFDALLWVVAGHARRPLDVRRPRCPSLGGDEEAMLRLAGALQGGDPRGALGVLADWLPQEAVPPALGAAQRFAALAAAAGLPLPAAAPPGPAAARPAAATLH